MEFEGKSGTSTTLLIPPVVTFTMFELSNINDCKELERYLINRGLKNISPIVAKQRTISFKGEIAKKYGADIIKQLQKTPADWLILSGHHGIIYASEYSNFVDDDQTFDRIRCYNNNKYAGFFNDDYHHGRWEQASTTLPERGESDCELYCSTTNPAPFDIAPFPQTNPYLPEEENLINALKSQCKGIILSGCNTLSYREVRKKWVENFPDAVIFGTYGRIKTGLYVIRALRTASSITKEFWLNPQAILDSSVDMPQRIAKEVFLEGIKKDINMGMIYKKIAYYGISKDTKMEELSFDFTF